MKRLDAALVERKLAPSRTKAQRMIEAGEVEVGAGQEWKPIHQPSYTVGIAQEIRVRPGGVTLKYVSRGGLKLEAALKHLALSVEGLKCLDIGISTGGFSDCLLQHGAARIVGVDVGHGQLSEALKTEPKLIQFEGLNIRDLAENEVVLAELRSGVDLAVVDVSFISLLHVFPVLKRVLPREAKILALVKPQFEVGAENLDKNGIVQDEELFAKVKTLVSQALSEQGFSVREYFASKVKGQDGNQEFFVLADRT